MPPKYFVFIDGDQTGPFSLDQLTGIGLHPGSYVWCKGMDDWQRADSVEEIRNLFRHHLATKSEPEIETVIPEEIPNRQATYQNPRGEETEAPKTRRPGFPLPEVEREVDLNQPPQVSMTLAVLSLLFCFPITGFVAVFFAYKAQKTWESALKGDAKSSDSEALKRQAHEYERMAKMWLGLTVAFGIIFWTLVFSVRK